MTISEPTAGNLANPSLRMTGLNELKGYKILSGEGSLGFVHDFLFEDDRWLIRYVVVDTGRWLPGRKVLLSPEALIQMNVQEGAFTVALTREQVQSSPETDLDQPVSRQHEQVLRAHYGWPVYWGPAGFGSGVAAPPNLPPPGAPLAPEGNPHLRSFREVCGYNIHATDGEMGEVADLIVEMPSWMVRYLVVATHKWLPGRKVLVAPPWLPHPISWTTKSVTVPWKRDTIKSSPEYDPEASLSRDYEGRLHEHYGKATYWK